MDRYVGDLISDIRHDTRNEDIESHPDSEILRHLQYAQDKLFSLITLSHNWVFEQEMDITIEGDVAKYAINDNLSYGTRITNVFYSHDGDERHFVRLKPSSFRPNRVFYRGHPVEYIRQHGAIILQPVPETTRGTLKVIYERSLDRLSLRIAKISEMPTTADITITQNDQTEFTSEKEAATEALFTPLKYFCINNFDGAVMLYNGKISSYEASTNKFVADPLNLNQQLATGYTLNDCADDGYLTLGKYSTTHSDLPNECIPYLVEWVTRKLHASDSSDQFLESDRILKEMERAIVASFKLPDKDVKPFPIADRELLIPGYD